MYFAGMPAQDHVIVPVEVFAVGVTVIVTACPVDVLAVLPVTLIRPASLTVAPDILPTMLMVTPTPMEAVFEGLDCSVSEIAVRALEAAKISSETLARTV